MACFRPLKGWRSRETAKGGGRGIAFNPRLGFSDLPMEVPCGQCVGCRLERSRMWAVRCVHEAQMHASNSFVTLTYREPPEGGSLVHKHFQDFMKRLRKWMGAKRVSYFMCGEYGTQLERPHYHALLFGCDFPDKSPWKKTGRGEQLFTSATLERLWGHGFVSIGAVSFESAAYTARYVMKKITGDLADDHYRRVDAQTGEVFNLAPEYVAMSCRPAVGRRWIERFGLDVYPDDFVVVRGRKMKPPRYYDKVRKSADYIAHRKLLLDRIGRGNTPSARKERTAERLAVREEVAHARVNLRDRALS